MGKSKRKKVVKTADQFRRGSNTTPSTKTDEKQPKDSAHPAPRPATSNQKDMESESSDDEPARVNVIASESSASDGAESPTDSRRRKTPTSGAGAVAPSSLLVAAPAAAAAAEPMDQPASTAATYPAYVVRDGYNVAVAFKRAQKAYTQAIEAAFGDDVTVRLRNDRFRLDFSSTEQQHAAANATELNGRPVNISLPWTADEKAAKKQAAGSHVTYRKVVIGGVSTDWSAVEVKDAAGATWAKRILRRQGDRLEPTTAVILGFIDEPPATVFVGKLRHRTRKYVEEPQRCYRCHRFGHRAAGCRSDRRCARCGGDHEYAGCPNMERPSCVNCRKPHPAGYGGCTAKKEAEAALKIVAAAPEMDYKKALLRVRVDKKKAGAATPTATSSSSRRPTTARPTPAATSTAPPTGSRPTTAPPTPAVTSPA